MLNKVELLRAFQYTKEDLTNITNLKDIADFTDDDKSFMEEFKQIYELGLNQLEKFINKLDEEGENLDSYSIQYYVRVLLNGPLGNYVRELSKDKKYFKEHSDSMGICGNVMRNNQNTTILDNLPYQLGCQVDTYNKLPQFLQLQLQDVVSQVENVFRTSMHTSTIMDNTLPLVDKEPQKRWTDEPSGDLEKKPIGNYCVKDVLYFSTLQDINSVIFDKVMEYLGEEDFRIFSDKKDYNPFDPDKNESTSKNYKIKRNLKEGELTQEVTLDLMGNIFDSEERRKSNLKIENAVKDKEYALGTNQGQLGI